MKGHPVLKEFGGTFTLKCEGDSVAYSACVVMPNTGEVKGKAELDDTGGFYFTVPECEEDVYFFVRVFRDALQVDVIPSSAEPHCFGEGATLMGWYLKK